MNGIVTFSTPRRNSKASTVTVDDPTRHTVLPAIFDTEPRCHGTGTARVSEQGIDVVTPTELWAYAISLPVVMRPAGERSIAVHIRLHVTYGRIGIGCANTAGTELLDQLFLDATEHATDVEVIVADSSDLGDLIVRNGSADGASTVTLIAVAASEIEDRDDLRDPPLSEPPAMAGWSRYYSTSGGTTIERLRAQRFDRLRAPVSIFWTDGCSFVIRPHEQLSRALYISGTYEPNTLRVLRVLTPAGGVFMDVGANVGLMSVVAARWVGPQGRVHAFEPSQREFTRLQENLRGNATRNVTALRSAVSNREGTVTLRVARDSHAGLNTLGTTFPYAGVDIERMESVSALTLDGYAARQGLTAIAVIKVDVEGAEGLVLAGASQVLRVHRPAIVLEVFSRALAANGWQLGDVLRLLRGVDYELFAIDDRDGTLRALRSSEVDEQNVVAVPHERAATIVSQLATL